MRIVIAGRDEVGRRLGEALCRDHEVVFLIPGATTVSLDHIDAMVVHGDMDGFDSLEKAGVGSADVFVACSRHDERNLISCLAARRLGVPRTICFLFHHLGRTAQDDLEIAKSLGIESLVRPARQLALEIIRIVAVPGALDVQFFAGGRVRLLQHAVEDGGPITADSLRGLKLPKDVVLVMGRRGDEIFVPTGDTRFLAGDRITAMGTSRGLSRLQRKFLQSVDHGRDARVATIVGGGDVGLAVAQGLAATGWTVRVIEANRERAEKIAPQIKGLVIHGDGSDLELLEQEQVSDDPVLVAVTNNDEKNLLVSLLARSVGIPRIITRADSLQNERLFEKVGIDVVRSARGAAIDTVLRRLDEGRRELLAELEHGDAEVLELELPPGIRARKLAQIHQPVFAIVGAILRGKRVIIPTGRDELHGGDHIFVFCTREDEPRVRRFFLEELLEEDGSAS
jgi:trk system potassium uptake protein TrkA